MGPRLVVLVVALVTCVAASQRPLLEEDLAVAVLRDLGAGQYDGEEDGQGRRQGRGNMTWGDGSVYSGSWAAGVMEGQGVMLYMVGDYQARYLGAWAGGKQVRGGRGGWQSGVFQTGNGSYYFTDGRLYKGGWKDGKQEG